jgi:hypothetical protein
MGNQKLIFSLAELSDYDQVLNMIANSFVEFDPLVNYLGISLEDFVTYAGPYIRASIQSNLALTAKNVENNTLAGVSIAHDVISDVEHDNSTLPHTLRNYIDFFQQLTAPLEKSAPASPGNILCAGFVAVSSQYYGANLPIQMNDGLLSAAKQQGYSVVVSEFTNPSNYYSYKRLFGERLKTANVLAFKDFINRDNERPMQTAHGECVLTVMNIGS